MAIFISASANGVMALMANGMAKMASVAQWRWLSVAS
jgi:hypothetical protein